MWWIAALSCLAGLGEGEEKVLFSFETPGEVQPGQGTAPIAASNLHATHGERSLSVRLDREEAGFGIESPGAGLDFRGARKLLLDVFNDGGPTSLVSRIYDDKGGTYVAWYYHLQPGENTVELDVAGMGHVVDVSAVKRLYFYVERPAGTLYVDHVRLSGSAIELDETSPLGFAARPRLDRAGNVLENGDFELGMAGWHSWGEWDGGEYQFGSGSGDDAYSGSASLAISCVRRGRGGVFTDPMAFRAGEYDLRFWAKGGGADSILRWTFEGQSPAAAAGRNLDSGPIRLGEAWKEFRYRVVLTTDVALRLYLFSIGAGTVYLDAVTLVPTAGAGRKGEAEPAKTVPRRVTTEGERIFVDGRPFFPIGIYHARPEALAGGGFNSVVALKVDREYLDACERAKIMVSPELTGVMRGRLPRRTPEAVEPWKNHPAIFGWYLCDEPDHAAWTVPPPEMRLATRLLRKADPAHPTWTVVMCWADSNLYQYADTVDILATDVYPIEEEGGRRPLVEVAEKTDALRRAVGGRKPVILVTQASKLVRPAELVALTYLAATHGAAGIFYFNYAEAVEDPACWGALVAITRELQGISPVLTSGEAREVRPSDGRIHALARRLGDRLYVVAVNEGAAPAAGVEFSSAEATGEPIQVLFERRTLQPSGGAWRDDFGGYERRVYSVPAK
jgi:hypothetical protein